MRDILVDLTGLLLDLQHSLRILPKLLDQGLKHEASALIGTESQRIVDQIKLFCKLTPEYKEVIKEALGRLDENNQVIVKKDVDYMG